MKQSVWRGAFLIPLVLALFLAPARGADAFRPLGNAVSSMVSKSGQIDFSEVGYVGSRCAALYTCIGNYMIESARGPDDKKSGKILVERAEIFWKVSSDINLKLKISPENIEKQLKLFIDHYSKEMSDGKRLNNIAITSEIEADLNQAVAVYPLFQSMADEIAKAEKRQ